MMKRTILAIAVLTSTSAFAAPSGSAYDRIQDSRMDVTRDLINDHQDQITQNRVDSEARDTALGNRITSVDTDLQGTKLGVLVVDQKADSALQQSSAALNLAGEARTDAQRANDRLDNLPVPKDGHDGVDGKNGRDGKDGTNGVDGQDGKDGAPGRDGAQGLQGVKGDKGDSIKGDTGAAGKDADMTKVHANTQDIKLLQTDVQLTQSVFTQRAADLDSRIAQQKADQTKTNRTVADHTKQLADHEKRIGQLEGQTNSQFSDLKNRIDDNKRNADAGIAGVAAMANIPQVTESQTFAIGAGAGTREGESAIAVGFSARASQNVVVKASVAGDTQQSWTVGTGVSYGW